jgi:AcrR family transcriptional regulator
MTKKSSDSKDTKKRLIEISSTLFASKGFNRVTIDEICAEAGLTKGSFYHHFSSKYDIPVQQYRMIQSEFFSDYEESYDLNFEERFKRAILWYGNYCTEDKVNVFINYHRVMMNYDKNRILRKIEIESKVFTDLLSQGIEKKIFRSDIDVDFSSHMLSRYISSLLLDWAIFKGAFDLAGELEKLHDHIVVDLKIRSR